MSVFPTLQTGAVLQYPASKSFGLSTQVVRFFDGSEQRFCDYTQVLNRWVVQLNMLTETELNSLREFFRIQDGAAGVFAFADPWDGTVYPSCSLETDVMTDVLTGEGRAKTTLIIRENKS